MWVFSAVLDLEFPTNIRALLNALKPFMIDLQSILQVCHIQQETVSLTKRVELYVLCSWTA
jgi:hypothetical protein